jgi:hypothetical protein
VAVATFKYTIISHHFAGVSKEKYEKAGRTRCCDQGSNQTSPECKWDGHDLKQLARCLGKWPLFVLRISRDITHAGPVGMTVVQPNNIKSLVMCSVFSGHMKQFVCVSIRLYKSGSLDPVVLAVYANNVEKFKSTGFGDTCHRFLAWLIRLLWRWRQHVHDRTRQSCEKPKSCIYKFSSYFTENTWRLRYKAQPINAV